MSAYPARIDYPGQVARALQGKIFFPTDPGFDEARQAWNLAVDQRPAAVVFPESAQDVLAAVAFAAETGQRIAAQGTGHNAAPLGSLADTVLLKTERMRGVRIDPQRRIARVQAGVVWLVVVQAAARHGLAALAGSSPDVGVVGYSLGGGLAASLDALGAGPVDLPQRQRTLWATVEWSVGLLDEAERSLLEAVAVFVDGWTIGAAAQVAGLGEDRVLELSESLARHSLVQLDSGSDGSRCQLLETVRAFVADRLEARPDAAEIRSRHADYYRALAEQADRPLRGADRAGWLERLQAEAGNLAAAVRWCMASNPGTLPHLFRILYPFWYLRDRQVEARPWVDQLLPAASFDVQARAELEWTATVIANEMGDDAAALAACQRLAPLLEAIQDPFLRDRPAGYGVDVADHRRPRPRLPGGVGQPGAAPQLGRALLDGPGRLHNRRPGDRPGPP